MIEVTEKDRYEFRQIRPAEIQECVEIEEICFPPEEANNWRQMVDRVAMASELFLVAFDRGEGRVAGFLTGIAVDEETFRDDFFVDATLHKEDGANVMILGLDVLPEYRHRGLGSRIMKEYMDIEKGRDRKKLFLTCHEDKIPFYQSMGYRHLGESNSSWGGSTWHDMVIDL